GRLLSVVTQAAFGQRRKMLRQSLKSLPLARDAGPVALLERAGIDPMLRAEDIDVRGFVTLATSYAALRPEAEN
ncbi:MAG: hypothetical protein JO163_06205, partial [Methylobacteriaceae bacterium]|nr:hypothetical protein [Methylobacteriaceae bacterium]